MKDDAWSAFEQLNQWIRYADAKAAVLLATSGVLGGILLSRPPSAGHYVAPVRNTSLGLALGAVVLAALVSLAAMLPRLRLRRSNPNPTSILYFDHIASRFDGQPDEFITAFNQASRDGEPMNREIVRQIWANSVVARRKFRRITTGTWLIGIALITSGVTIYLERI